jgi:hypothetical protein
VTLIGLFAAPALTSAALIDLNQTSTVTPSQTYSHTYDRDLPGGGFPDPNAVLTNVFVDNTPAFTANGNAYIVGTPASQGNLTFNVSTQPLVGWKLSSISVTSHTHDFGDGNVVGAWDTDLSGASTAFFDSDVDGSGIVDDTLSGAGIDGATGIDLRYTGTIPGGNLADRYFQQIFGVHDSAITEWTFQVAANYVVVPEPSTVTFALAGAGVLQFSRRWRS